MPNEDRVLKAFDAWAASVDEETVVGAFLAGHAAASASAEAEIERLKANLERFSALFAIHGNVHPEDLDDAADIVAAENGYLSRQLSLAASDIRVALNPEKTND